MALPDQLKNQHLMWRAGFGPAVEQLGDLSKYTTAQFYKALVKASSKKPEYINVADNYLQGLFMGAEQISRMEKQQMTPEEKRMIQQKHREGERNLNIFWLKEMVNSSAQLREKMAFFWHGHFACRNVNVFYEQALLDVLRRNALGNFGDMLKQVSRSAGMLNFLNNQQNRKGHPNENFAREVMELFTIGRGNYTEQDVKEAARAFTGWAANVQGDFTFKKNQHDDGSKTVLGQTGNFDGDEVLDILLAHKETATFICAKLFKFLVNPDPDPLRIGQMADKLFSSGYEIQPVLDLVFTSDWFFDPKNIGAIIKSPIELMVGVQRMVPMKLQDDQPLITLQRLLGQTLFAPPNVAGWPGGRTWIDSSTLMLRMRVPQLFNDEDELNVSPKADDDKMMGKMDDGTPSVPPKVEKPKGSYKGMKEINANLDWSAYEKYFARTDRARLVNAMAGVLLQTKSAVSENVIRSASDETTREAFIRSATIQLMSTPEYQLC
ncbi:MAG: DUF1800 domain-containing protein [Chitinophagaceae bacterium]|nr:MAG: DUF1800 domain-containing protein [Chitinophagaceae bacterium]